MILDCPSRILGPNTLLQMDVLSDILKVVKLDAALFFNGEFSAPWCFSARPSRDIAHHLSSSAGHLIIYHLLTDGRAYARLPDGRREELSAGDIVIFPHGDAHIVGNGSPVRPVDSITAFGRNISGELKAVRYGGGGEVTRFVCGYMGCHPRLSEVFLAGLPRILKVNIGQTASGEWIEKSIRFSAGQGPVGGSDSITTRLSEVLFVETLRSYIDSLPENQIGWFAAARDPVVGQALSLLHKEPDHAWTILNLARSVGLSRSRLAERFRHFLGESPIAYLTHWRLKLAAEMLQTSENSIAEVAATVGYGSEASFNRAFKREFACPPAQFRRQRRAIA